MTRHNCFALIAFALVLPVGLIVSSIVFEIAWLETMFNSFLTNNGDRPTTFGYIFMGTGLVLLPIGLVLALWPMCTKQKGKRIIYILNVLVAALILALLIEIFGGLVKDFYHCDILRIPNCD